MPRQPDGSFTLYPGYNPVASNTEIKADWANNTLSDIAAALSNPGAGVVIPTGGTVADTLANLFGYTLNVVSLAADKTGSVDAVSAFNAAVAAVNGGTVRVPGPATYKLGSNPNAGTFEIDSGVTFTGSGYLQGKIIQKNANSSTTIMKLSSVNQNNNQLEGFNVEQYLGQTGTNTAYNFAIACELFTPSASTTVWNGQQVSSYGSFSHFGSGALLAGFGGSFEAFNSGSATDTLICGVNGNASNGGVNAGNPVQIATNNGSVSTLRGVSGAAINKSSGNVGVADSVYAATITNIGGGVITDAVAFEAGDQTAGTNNYGVRTGKGLNSFGDAIAIKNKWNLPASTNTNLYMASAIGSPSVGRIYVGDGSGWQLEFAKRTGGVDTVLFTLLDSGALKMTPITAGSSVNNSLFIDSADGKLKFKDGSGTVNALY